MKCEKCGRDAIIHQRYSGMHLCAKHFGEDVERKIKRVIRKFSMIERNDRIAVALSGGKDSTVLLYVLDQILQPRRDVELIAITIDEGIDGYRENTIELATKMTKNLGIEQRVISFKDEYGICLDDICKKNNLSCTYCGVLRKSLLNREAMDLGATKLATGHNLNDEAQTVLMNYLKGDIERLGRFIPKTGVNRVPDVLSAHRPKLGRCPEGNSDVLSAHRPISGFAPRIKPLRDVPEEEVTLYGITQGLPIDLHRCPYAHLSMRSEVRDIINEFEMRHPGTKYSILRGFEKISGVLNEERKKLSMCRICGDPCVGEVCKACVLAEKIKSQGMRGKGFEPLNSSEIRP